MLKLNYQDLCQKEEVPEILAFCMQELSPEDRMAVNLHHLQGHSIKDSAKLMNWSVANMKIRVWRARSKLRKAVDNLLNKRKK